MSGNLELKKELVQQMVDEFKSAKSLIFVDYKGITVAEDTVLRKEFRAENVKYKVYKNRLMVRALEELGITGYDATMFEGTTAVAFSDDEIAPARVFVSNAEKLKKMSVKLWIKQKLKPWLKYLANQYLSLCCYVLLTVQHQLWLEH